MSEPSAPDGDHVVICWACGWARVARSHAAAVNRATTHGCQARPEIVSAAAIAQCQSDCLVADGGLPAQFRTLAALVERIEATGVTVADAQVLEADPDTEQLRVHLDVTAALTDEPRPDTRATESEDAVTVRALGTTDTPQWDLGAAPTDQSASDHGSVPDDASEPTLEDVLATEPGLGARTYERLRNGGFETIADIQAATVTELCAVDHIGETTAERLVEAVSDRDADAATDAADEQDATTRLEARIVDVLTEHGELPTKAIQTKTNSSKHVWNVLARLQEDGRLDVRQDPRDRRRKLYRLAGTDPTVVAEGPNEDTTDHTGESASTADTESESESGPESDSKSDSGPDTEPDTENAAETPSADETAPDETPDADSDDEETTDTETTTPAGRRECQCGTTVDGDLEWQVHQLEAHGTPQARLDYMEPGEFESLVEDAESVGEVIEACSWSRERTLRLLGIYGLSDVIGGDIEISAITDFEFDGLDDDEASDVADTEPESVPAADGGQTSTSHIDLAQFDISFTALVDAIATAQTVHQIHREMHQCSRDDIEALLDALGYLEQFQSGRPDVDRAAVKRRLAEVRA